ncbi:helix-turn-helix protein [Breznakia blatticola]|uniref:Helix-turn-helix protein n=1 Tax=Breznakia blatticola TaxID=1754012 RepID=A0A4R7Z915_9FIRM|nr:helix-turn-helix domain-containing protein [Breznakia blatticola]TDW13226.1 helix-turn-helix protein [Breznakia blatticola]
MTNKYKHLSDKERLSIETLLNEDAKLIDIANSIAKDPRGIKNEIYKHIILDVRKNAKNPYGNQLRCKTIHLCTDCQNGFCRFCSYHKCSDFCTIFCETPTCKRTTRFPYVCNACSDRKECKSPKFFYNHHLAHQDYKETISISKIGLKYDQVSLLKLNEIVSEGVRNGLSLEVIIANKKGIDISMATRSQLN